MKVQQLLYTLVAATMLICGACGKKTPPPPQAYDIGGVKVDAPKLSAALANAPQDVKAQCTEFEMALRYRMYDKAIPPLDKLANNPELNEQQKKTVNEVIEQIKQLINQQNTAK